MSRFTQALNLFIRRQARRATHGGVALRRPGRRALRFEQCEPRLALSTTFGSALAIESDNWQAGSYPASRFLDWQRIYGIGSPLAASSSLTNEGGAILLHSGPAPPSSWLSDGDSANFLGLDSMVSGGLIYANGYERGFGLNATPTISRSVMTIDPPAPEKTADEGGAIALSPQRLFLPTPTRSEGEKLASDLKADPPRESATAEARSMTSGSAPAESLRARAVVLEVADAGRVGGKLPVMNDAALATYQTIGAPAEPHAPAQPVPAAATEGAAELVRTAAVHEEADGEQANHRLAANDEQQAPMHGTHNAQTTRQASRASEMISAPHYFLTSGMISLAQPIDGRRQTTADDAIDAATAARDAALDSLSRQGESRAEVDSVALFTEPRSRVIAGAAVALAVGAGSLSRRRRQSQIESVEQVPRTGRGLRLTRLL